MAIIPFRATHKIALASVLTTLSLSSHAALPDGEYACQVMTVSGQSGLVLVQTDSKANAVRAAGAATAWEMGGGEGRVTSVVECINYPGEKFKDAQFNSFYKSFPL